MRAMKPVHTLAFMSQSANRPAEHFDTVVIGGGQTGLTTGHLLTEKGVDFVILDASARVGDVWRNRWDSLRLFTPARYSGLPGMKFPADGGHYVTKDEVAEYLERYASEMRLPVRSSTRVERLWHDGVAYVVDTSRGRVTSDNVVVAMADTQVPKVPHFAPDLDPSIVQLHSSAYRSPAQLQEGPVLVVGFGNSGADIGLELAKSHSLFISGEPTAVIPFRIESWFGREIGVRLVRFGAVHVLNGGNPIGRKVLPKLATKAAPVVRAWPDDLVAEGAERVPRVTAVIEGKPVLADGRRLDVANVVWCTGFRPGFEWIDLPVLDGGHPRHRRGVVEEQPGLYFCGLDFQYSLWSETLPGMPRDARHVIGHLTTRNRRAVPVAV